MKHIFIYLATLFFLPACFFSCERENPPDANFTANKTSIIVGETVQFTDQSSNGSSSWFWDFGDKRTSTYQNPSNTYYRAGKFTVEFRASNNYGDDSEIKIDYIIVSERVSSEETGTITDSRDGNTYKTVKLGNQWWMAENLAYLPMVSPTNKGSYTDPYYYVSEYEGTSTSEAIATANYSTYGVLYNWPAAMDTATSNISYIFDVQGICPAGWHIPSNVDWAELEYFLANGGYNYDGTTGDGRDKIAKAMATAYGWEMSFNSGAVGNTDYDSKRNTSEFSALPGGFYSNSNTTLIEAGSTGSWWTSNEYSSFSAYNRSINNAYTFVSIAGNSKENGLSVRCVRDN